MAIISFTNYKRGQTNGCMGAVMRYTMQDKKTEFDGQRLVTGINCQPESIYADFMTTKRLYHKTDGMLFYHMVQSFPKGEAVDPVAAHAAALKLAEYYEGYASVKNILVEEAYTGVLLNHRSETNGGKAKRLEQAKWYRHENFFPVIIERDTWEKAQQKLKAQARPANGNKAKHRYAGLLTCQECGNVFIPMIRYWNGKSRVEYVCCGYHRNGKSYCSSHRIHEETLDERVWALVSAARDSRAEELKKLAQMQKMWALRKPILDAHILSLQEKVLELEQEIDAIVMERIVTPHWPR